MPVNIRRDARSQRKRLIHLDRELTEEDLADRALVHALVQADWYRASMRRTRQRFLILEGGALLLAGAATVLAALSAPAWLTAGVAALVTFLAGLRRVVNWHDDWLAFSEAWAEASGIITKYRLLPVAERTPDRQQELVSTVDALVLTETRSWGRRRRELTQAAA
jgi:hypothetical protein